MQLKIFRFGLSPFCLFLVGTLVAGSPYLFTGYSFFNSYPAYETSITWSVIYFTGVISFFFGTLFPRLTFRPAKKRYSIALPVKTDRRIFWSSITLLCTLLILCFEMYGGIPLVMMALNSASANDINDAQAGSGGVLGVLQILQFLLLAFIPIMLSNDKKVAKSLRLFFYILLVFSMVIAGKRQMIFYSFFYLTSFYMMAQIIAQDTKNIRIIVIRGFWGLLAIMLLFAVIANLRTGTDNGVFYVIVHYLSLPFINNMHMFNLHGLTHTRDFFDIFEFALPTFFRNIMELESVITQPQLEHTISGGLYGRTFWAYGVLGVTIYSFVLGFLTQLLYQLAFRYKFFLFIYPLCVWPLLMVSTYDHFVNIMFFILPLFVLLGIRILYTGFRRI